MEQENNVGYYLEQIRKMPSYQDLVFFRNRMFDIIENTLSRDDIEAVKRAWTERAKDETLPVVPPGQKKVAEANGE